MVTIRGRVPSRVLRYFWDNLGAPFVAGFQVLLLVCVGLLVQGIRGWRMRWGYTPTICWWLGLFCN